MCSVYVLANARYEWSSPHLVIRREREIWGSWGKVLSSRGRNHSQDSEKGQTSKEWFTLRTRRKPFGVPLDYRKAGHYEMGTKKLGRGNS